MTELFELCIVIPCYNEEKRIDKERMYNFLKVHKNVLLCFVNDGSSDRTLEVLNTIKSNFPQNVDAISTDCNVGKAEAVRFGIAHCNAHYNHKKIAYLDADLATTLEECFDISKVVNSKVVFAFGSRIKKINENTEKFIELPSGLKYIITETKNGKKPKTGADIKVNYAGYFTDGRLFDTSYKEVAKSYQVYDHIRDSKGGYAPFTTQYSLEARLIPGFREGLLQMKVGDKALFFVPSHLGYGAQGKGGVIPPNTDLIFELEIVSLTN
ncbi:FKBP-type peptidyl-prolyl cis-trans isomerase [bacterium AH-315-A23]|nr:FKBP-type peptidyl-prolyl cis-trans isomerase [bacterium AH-315-A23]